MKKKIYKNGQMEMLKLEIKNLKQKSETYKRQRCDEEKNGRNIPESNEFEQIRYFQGKLNRGWTKR